MAYELKKFVRCILILVLIKFGTFKCMQIKEKEFDDDFKDEENEVHCKVRRRAVQQILALESLESAFKERCEANNLNWMGPLDEKFQELLSFCNEYKMNVACNENSEYRTFDGTCNNRIHTKWGSTNTPFTRLLPPSYDGLSGFRKSVTGEELPEPRSVTLKIFSGRESPFKDLSVLFTFFIELLVSDSFKTPVREIRGSCCDSSNGHNSKCANVYLPPDDFYSKRNQTCRSVVRSALYPSCNCDGIIAVNGMTSFIDGSYIYGDNEEVAHLLRMNDGSGKLKVQKTNCDSMVSNNTNWKDLFCMPKTISDCNLIGADKSLIRLNLVAFTKLLIREHNRIADILKNMNFEWSDEKIYQESRKIVIAEFQHIMYNECLPHLIGDFRVNMHKFLDDSEYNENVNPQIMQEFSTAALRLMHNVVPFKFDDINYKEPIRYIPSNRKYSFGEDLYNFLNAMPYHAFGIDITSITIQRGRDHGLQPYVVAVKQLLELDLNSWDSLTSLISRNDVELLRNTYKSVNDIDMWVGLALEIPVTGGIVGPTAAKIITLQLNNLKYGDRYFYTHRGYFTRDQLAVIRHISFAQLLCLHLNLTHIYLDPFRLPSERNPEISCQSLPVPTIEPWRVAHV